MQWLCIDLILGVAVMAKNPFYVYALKDPRQKPAKPFYIGKGTGTRVWEHEKQIELNSDKSRVIQEIHEAGLSVLKTVIADDLNEEQALRIEAELISAFGVQSRGGLLTNRVSPDPNLICKKLKVNIPDGSYEKAQVGLDLIKAAMMECIAANPDGLQNADLAKYLGLQSDYGGGSKDYLSYSILGLLLKEGLIERNERKHKVRK